MSGIVAGIDGSQHSHCALEWAMRYAALRHLPLTVITVAENVTPGSRGTGGFARLMAGSVCTQAVHHARCPVVTVPGPRED